MTWPLAAMTEQRPTATVVQEPLSLASPEGPLPGMGPALADIPARVTHVKHRRGERACGLAHRGQPDLPLLRGGRAGRRSARRSTADLLELRWPGRRDRPTHRALGPPARGGGHDVAALCPRLAGSRPDVEGHEWKWTIAVRG